jgi:hypothetical protein
MRGWTLARTPAGVGQSSPVSNRGSSRQYGRSSKRDNNDADKTAVFNEFSSHEHHHLCDIGWLYSRLQAVSG